MTSSYDNLDSLRQLFLQQLDSLYDGEQRIAHALPDLISRATSVDLKSALLHDLAIVRRQIGRLNRIFGDLGHRPGVEPGNGIEALLAEGDSLLARTQNPAVCDTCILLTAQYLEHYEIAGYGAVRDFAIQLGWGSLGRILEQCLSEEKEGGKKFAEISEALGRRARSAA